VSKLKETPTIGVPLGKDCYKIRLSITSKGKGKSSGARVITLFLFSQTTVYLLSIFDKSEHANISKKEIEALMNEVDF